MGGIIEQELLTWIKDIRKSHYTTYNKRHLNSYIDYEDTEKKYISNLVCYIW